MRTRNAEKEEMVKKLAIQMIAADGLENFSVNKLAKACDISVATLYIYYKDKDDLIFRLALEEGQRLHDVVHKDFDPDAPFAEGLRLQWKNRARHFMEYPDAVNFFEKLRYSSYHNKASEALSDSFKKMMRQFLGNAIKRKEISSMSEEVFWSVAFAPLYALLRFHKDGSSIGGRPFAISNKIIWQTFDLVLRALKI
ncbi:TetR/AcrR family transcriptional regulator [Chitinophaga sp. Mgbs1]|uniref:TetR/AcrR family transcriptional regulator n=1 Tax=Chitinophaga solisilvae TaxID=1233460 RepID=A0A433WDV7_9BACT|nr:TetR/AcrR family transcriptional regulator [Chitinophaga solisilvae]